MTPLARFRAGNAAVVISVTGPDGELDRIRVPAQPLWTRLGWMLRCLPSDAFDELRRLFGRAC